MALRVANWNVYHGNITATGTTPQSRMTAFTAYCATINVDIIGLQEVPGTVAAGTLATTIGTTNYVGLASTSEYPPTPANPAPASKTTDGYVILYNPNRVTPTTGVGFVSASNFRPGTAQCRPPVGCQFRNAGSTANCFFSTWHNEAGSTAVYGMISLHNSYVNAGGNHIITGDFNVPAQNALKNPFFPGWNATTDNLDAILTNCKVQDVALAAPAPFKSDVHFAMVADIAITW